MPISSPPNAFNYQRLGRQKPPLTYQTNPNRLGVSPLGLPEKTSPLEIHEKKPPQTHPEPKIGSSLQRDPRNPKRRNRRRRTAWNCPLLGSPKKARLTSLKRSLDPTPNPHQNPTPNPPNPPHPPNPSLRFRRFRAQCPAKMLAACLAFGLAMTFAERASEASGASEARQGAQMTRSSREVRILSCPFSDPPLRVTNF